MVIYNSLYIVEDLYASTIISTVDPIIAMIILFIVLGFVLLQVIFIH